MNMISKRKDTYDSQVKLFKALMHPGRLAILDVLRAGEACVCHMEAGLVDDRRDGWNVYYRVVKPDVFAVIEAARSTLGEKKRTSSPAVIPACACPHCTGEKANASIAVAKAV
jgi:ArsR family transcriptional regulator